MHKGCLGLGDGKDTWDTHIHVFEAERVPFAKGRRYTPAAAPAAHLIRISSAQNFLIVQASIEDGEANVLLQVKELQKTYPSRKFRAALIFEDRRSGQYLTPSRIHSLHEAGVRCLRYRKQAGMSVGAIADDVKRLLLGPMADAARTKRWAISMQLPLAVWSDLAELLRTLGKEVCLIAEHCAGITVPLMARDSQALDGLIELVHCGVLFVKLGALHRRVVEGGTMDQLRGPFRRLADAGPHQLMYGSDWPHVDSSPNGLSENAHLPIDADGELDWLRKCLPTQAFETMLSSTPARLFGD